jgi:tetratricopeptide (TPR) repeat protein/2-polyprenyl-3-methyl-5-hydroxy-6-metoxy-1,4-benzoquinol methylase
VTALTNRANTLNELGRFQDAINSSDRALAINPNHLDAFIPRGAALFASGRYAEALETYERPLRHNPNIAMAWIGRGNVLFELKRYDEALAAYDRSLTLRSDLSASWLGRGKVLSVLQQYAEARTAYQRALAIKPDLFEAIDSLVRVLLAEDNVTEAFSVAKRALAADETPGAKALVGGCLSSPLMHPSIGGLDELRDLMLRAMSEPWADPGALAPNCVRFLLFDPAIGEGVARALKAWPARLSVDELASPAGLGAIANDKLLRTLLESTPVCDVRLERFATGLRFSLVEQARAVTSHAVAEPVLALYCALARQCFINSYAFAVADEEIEEARELREALVVALASGATIPSLLPVAVAAYFPLYTLPGVEHLLERAWPDATNAVFTQQIRAPLEEQRLRASMPALTAVQDGTSMRVRDQYEEHPYPAWVKMAPGREARSPDEFMSRTFPLAPFVTTGKSDSIDVLVAGCGTGRHPILSASRFKGSQVLAIDLSLASLGYAQRQTQAHGLKTIQYAQADIMKLSSIGRTFDVIESVGVLHHLADPFSGWRVLLSMLRPRGNMLLGFYSEIGRQIFASARSLIAQRGYRQTADDIRRFRQEVLECPADSPLKNTALTTDFFSLSECRDLLFHVQEHRLTLPEIASFLAANDLQFLGFETEMKTQQSYARRFPADVSMTSLEQWHQYETENPLTFVNMYVFWVQKK